MAAIRIVCVIFCWICVGFVAISSAEETSTICYSDDNDLDDCGGSCIGGLSWGHCVYDCSRARDRKMCTIYSTCFFVLGLIVGFCVAGIVAYAINKKLENRQAKVKTLHGSDNSPRDIQTDGTPRLPCTPSEIQPRLVNSGLRSKPTGRPSPMSRSKGPLKIVRARDEYVDGYGSITPSRNMTSSRTLTTSVMARNSGPSGLLSSEW